MSLDLTKVAVQVDQMVGRLTTSFADGRRRLRAALDTMHDVSGDTDALRKKIRDSKTTWLVAGVTDRLDRRYVPPALPPDYTVMATDGSQIAVDRHQAARCYLLNISRIVLRYGAQPNSVLESVPQLYAEEKDMVITPPPGRDRDQVIDSTLLSAKRSIEECRHLADLAASATPGSTVLALLDGTLMLWGLEGYPGFVRDVLLERGLLAEVERIRGSARDKRLALASYISAPRSADVANAIRVAVCPHEPANCDNNCDGGKRACDALAGIVDSQLFFSLLAPGERSSVFASRSKIVEERYGEHKIHFFYLRLDDEVARVEVPAWVATDQQLLGLTHRLILDQCRKGHGYPVALSEAHEQAVVTGADRENFWQLVETGLVGEHLPTPTTGKSQSKRTRWL